MKNFSKCMLVVVSILMSPLGSTNVLWPNTDMLISNPGFDGWGANGPAGWSWREGVQQVTRLENAYNDSVAIEFFGPNAVYQTLQQPNLRAGDIVVFECAIQAKLPARAFSEVQVGFQDKAKEYERSRGEITGSGEWERVTAAFTVNSDDIAAVRLAVHIEANPQATVRVADLRGYVLSQLP